MGCASSRPVLRCLRPSVAGGGASDPVDEVLGHSFCYSRSSSLSSAAAGETSFKSISGAALSANSSAPLPSFPFRASSDSAASASSRFLSGPISLSDRLDSVSGPLPRRPPLSRKPSLLRRSLSERNRPWVVPLRSSASRRSDLDANLAGRGGGRGVQWARGKAGEDRVHVVVSEEHRWVFVGIYDGFNGPDAPEFLVSRLYSSLLIHLEGLFWHEEDEQQHSHIISESSKPLRKFLDDRDEDAEFDLSGSGRFSFSMSRLKYELGKFRAPSRYRVAREVKKRVRIQRRRKAGPVEDHGLVLGALARALEVTEMEYLEMTDRTMGSNPELAMTGSCLLVVLMRDDDVYVMNVGDSRAIVAQSGDAVGVTELVALQLSTDHSTSIEQEVLRIQQEHPDDNQCVVNNRVKGRLKVTRAFGAGFLKHPKWNNGLLEMFRNDYIGTAPYVTSSPSLCHHKLGADDQFLVLSSDGLYQYLSNEEVVLHVQNFMVRFPDGDPAQSLIEELLSRAAKNAGMELSELLDIPQGDRRKYHDDVTVMVISLEGRIWKSSEKCL